MIRLARLVLDWEREVEERQRAIHGTAKTPSDSIHASSPPGVSAPLLATGILPCARPSGGVSNSSEGSALACFGIHHQPKAIQVPLEAELEEIRGLLDAILAELGVEDRIRTQEQGS
jgi:hypothetical protein